MLYKLLIVEDESDIRKGLCSIVNWHEIGFELIGDTGNGLEAMEYIRNCQKPDVILTDIRMSVMDGLQLIQEVRKFNYDIQFIILSGYNYFDYAKKAIELGAFEYILKPTKIKELKEKFIKLKEHLDNNEKNKNIISQSKKFLEESCLNDLIYKNFSDIQAIKNSMLDCDVYFSKGAGFAAVVLKILGIHPDKSLKTICQHAFEEIDHIIQYTSIVDKQGNIVIIFYANGVKGKEIEENHLEFIAKNIMGSLKGNGLNGMIGIGCKVNDIGHLSKSYEQALNALDKCFFKGMNWICKFSLCSYTKNKLYYPLEYEQKIIVLLGKCDKLESYNTIERLFSNILFHESYESEQVCKICIEMMIIIQRSINADILKKGDSVMDENILYFERPSGFDTFEQLKLWFKERIYMLIDILNSANDCSNSRIINYIKELISKKYQDQITLGSIAEDLFMNPNYLSRLFKKEMNTNFTEYLTTYRIEKAKEFFRDVTNKSYEVGFRVGYPDATYFGKIFKKVTSMSISEYRNKSI